MLSACEKVITRYRLFSAFGATTVNGAKLALSVRTKSPYVFPRIYRGCIWALALRSHHMKPPSALGDGRCDRLEFRSSQPA